MSKAIEGAVLIAAGIVLEFVPGGQLIGTALIISGATLEVASLAALFSTQGSGYTVRQPAPFRQIIYGVQRVGGIFAYLSTTGSHKDQNNFIIVLAGHEIECIENLYLDGRQVFWAGGVGNVNRGGVNFGGAAAGGSHTGPGGQNYDFGSLVYCEARYGDQTDTSAGPDFPGGTASVIGGMTANDPTWAAAGGKAPLLRGCAYVYLKLEYDTAMFPNTPGGVEIKFTVRGKKDIWDPRAGTKGFSTNAALICADVIRDTTFGLADVDAFQDAGSVAQLIAAANICDESVFVESTQSNEARYACHYHYDSSAAPGDALATMLQSMAGRISLIGGEWYIFPAAFLGVSATIDVAAQSAGALEWNPNRSAKDLANRVSGTYIAPNWPWNTAGNLYDSNGFFNGSIQNNFPFGFEPASFPMYAQDTTHGYAGDANLEEDSQLLGAYDSGTTYGLGDVVSESGVMYKSLIDANVGHDPASSPADWAPYANLLTKELTLRSVLSITQAQRLAKIELMRNRQQGSGTLRLMQSALKQQVQDVIAVNFGAMGWSSKTLEIMGFTGAIEYGDGKSAPRETLELAVQETSADVTAWDPATEELDVYGNPAVGGTAYAGYPPPPPAIPLQIAPPTGLGLLSDATTLYSSGSGTVYPQILASWTAPADVRVTQVQVQYQAVGAGGWTDWGSVVAAATSALIGGSLVRGTQYNVRVRSLAINGATSVWVQAGPVTAFAPASTGSMVFLDSDGSGNFWQMTVAGGGEVTTKVSTGPGVSAVVLIDTGDGSLWALSVTGGGLVLTKVSSGVGVSSVSFTDTADGSTWVLTVAGGAPVYTKV